MSLDGQPLGRLNDSALNVLRKSPMELSMTKGKLSTAHLCSHRMERLGF
jgi:hypothetical protein